MAFVDDQIEWSIDGRSCRIGLTRFGDGPHILLLPALSSFSTRWEMRPLQTRLGERYATVAVDWPGFGTLPRPKIDWRPEHFRSFLRFLLETVVQPSVTIAAGHAASHVLDQSADYPGSAGRLCLLSPTWRGPLPTMTGRRVRLFRVLARMVDVPLIGSAFYRINVNGPVIGMMARGHVYDDPTWMTPARMAEKRAVTEARGARHASFRFVAGELDLFQEREQFLSAGNRVGSHIFVHYGKNTPRKSKAEMLALAALGNVTATELPVGKLSFYEEFPDVTAEAIFQALGKEGT